MKGYEVNIRVDDSRPEISRRILIPQKTKFYQLKKIIIKAFSLSEDSFFIFENSEFKIDRDEDLIDDYINQGIYFSYNVDFEYNYFIEDVIAIGLRFAVTLCRTVDYEKNFPTLISHSGDYDSIENSNMPIMNSLNTAKNDPKAFSIENVQNELNKIIIYKYNALEINIRHLKSNRDMWRRYLIPENTAFDQLEEIILISFDTNQDSFNLNEKLIIDVFKSKSKIYSENGEFCIELIKKIYSTKGYPILKSFEGGLNPFDMWFEYYPEEIDKSQSSLDAFI